MSQALEAGQTLGNYRLMRRLGKGGMGDVYLAEHTVIGKKVALKIVREDLALSQEIVLRFVREAQAVSAIGSPHIVDVHDFSTSDSGVHFLVMEFLEGETLASRQRRRPLTAAQALHVAAQVAEGLGAAHRHQVIHRDLKPDNIMLTRAGHDDLFVKILDFGLAKVLQANAKLTGRGVVLGTPEYMSPEAAESKEVSPASDIYALGVLLFEMLTFRLPFEAPSMGEMMVQHVASPAPDPRQFRPNLGAELSDVVLRCLRKDPGERYQSMEELRDCLRELSADAGTLTVEYGTTTVPLTAMSSAGVERGRFGIRLAILAGLALLSAAAGAALAWTGSATVAEVTPLPSSTTQTERSADPGAAAELLIPPLEEEVDFSVTSEPSEAEVFNALGERMGTTPFRGRALKGAEVAWTFRRKHRENVVLQFVVTGSPVHVELPVTPKRSKKSRLGNDVIAPSFSF